MEKNPDLISKVFSGPRSSRGTGNGFPNPVKFGLAAQFAAEFIY